MANCDSPLIELTRGVRPCDLPLGVYVTAKDGQFHDCNDRLRKILELPPKGPVNDNIARFYSNPTDRTILMKEADEAQPPGTFIENRSVCFNVKEREVWVSLTCRAVYVSGTNDVVGYMGYMVEITKDVALGPAYRQIMDEIPVGVYEIRITDGKHIIRHCNNSFARIYGYENAQQIINQNILQFYDDEKRHEQFLREMHKRHKQGEPLLGYAETVRKQDGTLTTVEVNSRFLLDPENTIIGRIGMLRDISDETALWHLKEDIGGTLHHFTSSLMMIEQAIRPLQKLLGRAPFSGERIPSILHGEAYLAQLARRVSGLLVALTQADDFRKVLRDMNIESDGERLSQELDNLMDYDRRIPYPALQVPALRDSSSNIIDLLDSIGIGGSLGEQIRQTQRATEDLERLCCLIALHRIVDHITGMDHHTRALREYVTFHGQIHEDTEICLLRRLVVDGMANLFPFARMRNVEFTFENASEGCMVEVRRRHIIRAIGNLLHNAIKYSWYRPAEKRNYVKIRSRFTGDSVVVEIENYGVPITKEELDKDLIFEIGYRGVKSGDKGRLGTGVGLGDARKVAQEHKGDVRITSRPALPSTRPGDYTDPYVTTAILSLPVHHVEETADEI
ncbi:MAG TPA: PAS domain-containing protein [Candidatus Deferrimicrobium sp.]|nr:PAS domain-containing protein [Candidatus Deferrimicrobium sp.]